MAVVLLLLGLWLFWRGHALPAAILGLLIVALSLLTVAAPDVLTPANRAWMRFGALLGRIVSPLVLGLMFFLTITPVAVITRAFGRDPLRLKRRAVQSYWLERSPPGPAPGSLNRQY
jgi:hypothetical protein